MNNAQTCIIIKELCKKQNIAVSKMLAETAIRRSLIYDMEKRDYTPSAEILDNIADYLNRSVDYLLGRTNNPDINNGNNITTGNINGNHNANISVGATLLSNDEEEILKMVRELSLIQRSELVITINKMKSDNKI